MVLWRSLLGHIGPLVLLFWGLTFQSKGYSEFDSFSLHVKNPGINRTGRDPTNICKI